MGPLLNWVSVLLQHPVRRLMAAEVLCLIVVMVVLVARWHWRRFPLMAIFVAAMAGKLCWLLTATNHAEYLAIERSTVDASAFLMMMIAAESVWELWKAALEPHRYRHFATAFSTSLYFTIPALALWVINGATKDMRVMQIVQLALCTWAVTLILAVMNKLRYAFEVPRAVFWHARIVSLYLAGGFLANWAGILRLWKLAGWLHIGVTIAACACWCWVMRARRSEDEPSTESADVSATT